MGSAGFAFQLDILGAVRVRGQRHDVAVRASAPAALLGYLALHAEPGQGQRREVVAERLYPERPPLRAHSALSDAIYAVRRLLGPLAGCFHVSRYELQLSETSIDADRFDALARSHRADDWREALALYRGDLLSGLDAEWLEVRRRDLHNRRLGLYEQLVAERERSGAFDEALDVARWWVLADPLSEPAHMAVMRLYAKLGQPWAAQRQYEHLRWLLESEMGIEPMPETTEVADSIRRSVRPTADQSSRSELNNAQQPHIRSVLLTRATTPLGRRLTDHDRVLVRWTLDAGGTDAAVLKAGTKADLRRHRILRLLAEAEAQGARPTDQDLADALGVTRRTIEADMVVLRRQGLALMTRRRGGS